MLPRQMKMQPCHFSAIPPLSTGASALGHSCLQLYLFHILLPQPSLTNFSCWFSCWYSLCLSPPRQKEGRALSANVCQDVRNPRAWCRAGEQLKTLNKSKENLPSSYLGIWLYFSVSFTVKTQWDAVAFTGFCYQHRVIILKGSFVQICLSSTVGKPSAPSSIYHLNIKGFLKNQGNK